MIRNILRSILAVVLKNCPDGFRVRYFFYRNYGFFPKLSSPTLFNERVTQRILFEKNPIFSLLADKYRVRDFIGKVLGHEYLIPLIKASDIPDDLLEIQDWSGLVVKPNHAAGMIRIYDNDPGIEEKLKLIGLAKKWLSVDFSKYANEWHYSKIKPIILAEKKITKGNEIPRDYKFHCFKQADGSINYVLQLVDGRFSNESRGYYLNSLDNLVWYHGAGNHLLDNNEINILHDAICLNKKVMDNLNLNYVRIDWYIVGEKLFFGEITCTPGAGRSNEFGLDLEVQMFKWWL